MARDGGLSLAVLRGFEPSQDGLHQHSDLGSWFGGCGRKIAHYSEIKATFDSLENYLRTAI